MNKEMRPSRNRRIRVGGDVMIRGGVVRIRWSALESNGTMGAGFSVDNVQRHAISRLSAVIVTHLQT